MAKLAYAPYLGSEMAERKRASGQAELFQETKDLIALLSKESTQDLALLVIPSHDRHKRELAEALTAEWASNGLALMADLYRGATAYQAAHGIYKTDEGEYLHDHPLVIESFATEEAIQDPVRLNLLVGFCKRMGKTLNQDAIMVAFGTVMYYIQDYSGV